MSQPPNNSSPNTPPTPPTSPGTQSSPATSGTKQSNEVLLWLFCICLLIGICIAIVGAFIQNNIIMSIFGVIFTGLGILPIGLQQAFPSFFPRLRKSLRTGFIFFFVLSLALNAYDTFIVIRSGSNSPSFPINHPKYVSSKGVATSTPASRATTHSTSTPMPSLTPTIQPIPTQTPVQVPTPVPTSAPVTGSTAKSATITITNYNEWEQKDVPLESCLLFNGAYQDFESKSIDANLCRMLNTPDAANFDASMMLSISSASSGACGGFLFNDDSDSTSYYRVQVCPSSHTVVWVKRFDNSQNDLGTAANIVTGNTFSLRVTFINGVLSAFVNGTKVTFFDTNGQSVQEDLSNPLPHSFFGVVASTHSGDVTVTFSQPVIHFIP